MNFELFPDDLICDAANLHSRIHRCVEPKLQHIAISEKWILSSALQKSIRRGLGVQAVSVAYCLHRIDQSYLRRRLPIIALEDIGLGDIGTCLDVIAICTTHHYWQQNVERTIAYMVLEMAKAKKSRAACDSLCWSSVDRDGKKLRERLQRLNTKDLVDHLVNPDNIFVERILCARILNEQIHVRREWQTRKQPDCDWLDRVASELNLPAELLKLSRYAKTITAMACTLPVVFHVAGKSNTKVGKPFPRSSELWGGVLLGSLDQYTKLGRIAISEMVNQSPDLQKFANYKVRTANPIIAIRLCLFQIESACLEHYLSSPGLDEITAGSERAELIAVGVEAQDHHELARLLFYHADSLADTRKAVLNRFGISKGSYF